MLGSSQNGLSTGIVGILHQGTAVDLDIITEVERRGSATDREGESAGHLLNSFHPGRWRCICPEPDD